MDASISEARDSNAISTKLLAADSTISSSQEVRASIDSASTLSSAMNTAPPPRVAPLFIEVSKEFNDGKTLHVFSRVTALTDWPTDQVILRLAGFYWGEPVREKFFRLSEILASENGDKNSTTILKANKSNEIYLQIQSENLSDYQVELLWGEEARAFLKSRWGEASVTIQKLEISSSESSCPKITDDLASSECPDRYTVLATLFNPSHLVVENAVLGVGYVASQENSPGVDSTSRIPENEETLELNDLTLKPGESRLVRLILDHPTSKNQSGSSNHLSDLVPVIRVVDVKAK